MAQNRSHAVMQQRVEPPDSLDFFPTPPWATRALLEQLAPDHRLAGQTVWEPACGEGHMVRPLAEAFARVIASDVHLYSAEQDAVCDFLIGWDHPREIRPPHWVITNPPFRLGSEFALAAIAVAEIGVALFTRAGFLEGGAAKDGSSRYARLFKPHPPTRVLQFCERVPILKGRLDKDASTSTSYCWIVWERDCAPRPFGWIEPCRSRLERAEDYQ